jgi:arsenite oxidase small subunit
LTFDGFDTCRRFHNVLIVYRTHEFVLDMTIIKEAGMMDVKRRNFLKGGVASLAVASGLVGVGNQGAAEAATPQPENTYPTVDIAPLVSIPPGTEVAFDYPDEASPSVLLRLGKPAEGGIGPEKDIVAFSLLCTHKGCPLNYVADRKTLVCPCHWSSFDPSKGGRLVIGQASQSLPQMQLDIQDGMVRAVGLDGLIYGRHTNIL